MNLLAFSFLVVCLLSGSLIAAKKPSTTSNPAIIYIRERAVDNVKVCRSLKEKGYELNKFCTDLLKSLEPTKKPRRKKKKKQGPENN